MNLGEHPEALTYSDPPDVELRGGTMNPPTDEMWAAMHDASTHMGYGPRGEDPSVNELEALAAEMLGKEAALFVTTNTLGGFLALMTAATPGQQVVLEHRTHMYWFERLTVSRFFGLAPRLLKGDKFGAFTPQSLEEVLTEEFYGWRLPTGLVCLENTHNVCGGTVLSQDYMSEISRVAHAHGVPVYVDGARIFNAAAAAGMPARDLVKDVDYVTVSLNKGLGAPIGAILCGPRAFVSEARKNYARLGAESVHKSGIVAAAAIVALRTTSVGRLEEDHRKAKVLARGVGSIAGLSVDMETVQTNIVRVETHASGLDAKGWLDRLRQRGISGSILEPFAMKFITHKGLTDAMVDRAVQVLSDVAEVPHQAAV